MPTLSNSQLMGAKVFKTLPPEKALDRAGNQRRAPRLGRIHAVVFDPSGMRAVGVQVKQPDVAAMIARPDVFVALDALEPAEKGYACSASAGATDKAALKRLGLNYDACLIWGGMDVLTESGTRLGYVGDVVFDAETGEISEVHVTEGDTASALVGERVFGADAIRGQRDAHMIVADGVELSEFTGGLAGKAGEATAAAQAKAAELGERAGEAAEKAATKGGHAVGKAVGKAKAAAASAGQSAQAAAERSGVELTPEGAGRAVGRQLGKLGGMFADFKREFDEASK